MKKHLFILLFVLTGASLYAQETSLALEVVPGKLASQLTKEQMSSVKELTLTGEMYNCDFYVIRDSMNLQLLDISQVIADTIPEEGLYGTNLRSITLPRTLAVIEDKAFFKSLLEEVLWINFPEEIGDNIFRECYHLHSFITTDDAVNCKAIDGVLFSNDKTKLLLYPANGECNYYIPEGTKIIGEKAFMGTSLYNSISMPSSLEVIEDKSFEVEIRTTSNGVSVAIYNVKCLSLVPPVCKGDPFGYNREEYPFPQLEVPLESIDLYMNDPYWGEFFKGHPRPNSVFSPQTYDYIRIENGSVCISINKRQNALFHLFDIEGKNIGNYPIDNSYTIINNLQNGTYFYHLETDGGMLDKGKIIIKK